MDQRATEFEQALRRIVQLVLEDDACAEELKITPDEADFGPRLRAAIGPELFSYLEDGSRDQTHELVKGLLAGLRPLQNETLRTVIKRAPDRRDEICPMRYINPASARSLERLGLLRKCSYPLVGYQLSPPYGAAAAEIIKKSEEQS